MSTKIEKWKRWLPVIKEDITHTVRARSIFWAVQKLIETNEDLHRPSAFYEYLGVSYVSHSVMGIRRQIKIDRDSISLMGLMAEIHANPQCVARESYRSLYDGYSSRGMADEFFDDFCDNPGDNHVSPTKIAFDLALLARTADAYEQFADRRIAHRDKREPKSLPIFSEVDSVIDMLDKLCIEYNSVITAYSVTSILPNIQYDWQEIFDIPWRRRR